MKRSREYKEANDKVTEMKTLSSVHTKMVQEGFTHNFKVIAQGLQEEGSGKTYSPEEVQVVNFYRFEGESDPGDNAILYVIRTADGTQGTLIDAYGMYADEKVNVFMQQVENISKKTDKK